MITKLAGADDDKRLVFWCPGCEEPHMPRIRGNGSWTWNGDRDKPTLSPSVLVTDSSGSRCHSFVRDGAIEFLGDCTHAMANRTVPLPEWPYAEGAYGGVDEDAATRTGEE